MINGKGVVLAKGSLLFTTEHTEHTEITEMLTSETVAYYLQFLDVYLSLTFKINFY